MVIDMVDLGEDVDDGFRTASKKNRLVLLHFTAEWCGACIIQEEILKQNVIPQLKNDLVFIKINVDSHEDLIAQYNVQSIPLLILLSADNSEKWRKAGISEREEIEKAIAG